MDDCNVIAKNCFIILQNKSRYLKTRFLFEPCHHQRLNYKKAPPFVGRCRRYGKFQTSRFDCLQKKRIVLYVPHFKCFISTNSHL